MFIIFLLLCIENAFMFLMLAGGGLYKWPTKQHILLALNYVEIILNRRCSHTH